MVQDKMYCATENGLFYYDLQDQSVNKITKITGLSDVDITAMAYHEEKNVLVIGYSSGGIDLVTEEGFFAIQDFKNTDLVSEKAIHDIQFWNDDILVATSLGVIVISIPNREITENFRSIGQNGTDISVSSLFVKDDDLWAITNQGIQVGSLNNNLLDFNNWTFFGETQNQKNTFFGSIGNQIFSIKNDSVLLSFENNSWVETGVVFPDQVVAVRSSSELFISTSKSIYSFNGIALNIAITPSEAINDFLFSNEFWLSTETNGLTRHETGESIYPEGPINDYPSNIVAANGEVYLLFGPSAESYNGEVDQLGYNVYDGNTWKYEMIDGFYNLSDIAYWNNQGYVSSVGFGIYSMDNGMIIDHNTSTLSNSKSNQGPIITDLEVSASLWIASYNNTNPIASINENGEITTYQESVVGTDKPQKIISSLEGPILIQNDPTEGGGFITFRPPNARKHFSISNGLPSNAIHVLEVDLEDVAWAGTDQGLITFPDASYLIDFAQPVNATFENNLLFENDEILALTLDGGNRAWIATQAGLWVFNASLTRLDHFFTAENSPLPSNQITQLEYNAENGEMFIQTDKGLVSFRSSSSAAKAHYDEVSIFPNPVRPGYSGLVGISGLRYGTYVKITNIDGKLIREIETNGGTASWDLLDYNNQKVNSGVYVVFTSSPDGQEKYVGKIAVVN